MRLLLTRPRADDDELPGLLAATGHIVIHEPLLTIRALSFDPVEPGTLRAIAVTSANAVRSLPPGHGLERVPVFAVGPATARAARRAGFRDVTEAHGEAAGLAETLARQTEASGAPILYLRGEDVAFDIAAALGARGLRPVSRIVYRAEALAALSTSTVQVLKAGHIDGTLLLSPRTAAVYASLVTEAGIFETVRALPHFCLSARVAAPLGQAGINLILSPAKPSLKELVALIGRQATQSAERA